jgi:nitroimidazol reductase NimA-like FMN-containing flavoprotein (pyridoxamine 5'-phosphate oxidase superfamily)
MFREMRRKLQELSKEQCIEVLRRGKSGVLATSGDDDYPYAVPLSYNYADGKIVFHCARAGHKLDGIRRNKKVSFCVVDKDDVRPKEFTTYFRSVIAFGEAEILKDFDAKKSAIEKLALRYAPDFKQEGLEYIEKAFDTFHVVEIKITHMTGKAAEELLEKPVS